MAPVLLNPYRFGVALTPYGQQVMADSPAFYLPMQETSGLTATDVSGNSRNGTMVGGSFLADGGIVPGGNAWSQDGSSGKYGSLSYSSINVGALTLEAWAKPAASLGTNTAPTLVAHSLYYANLTTDFPISLLASPDNSSKLFTLRSDPGGDYTNNTQISAPTAWTADTWYHVVGVFQNGTSRLYVNASEVANAATAYNLSTGGGNWTIGTMTDFGGGAGLSRFNGRLAHVAMYPAALSAARIAAHYAAA